MRSTFTLITPSDYMRRLDRVFIISNDMINNLLFVAIMSHVKIYQHRVAPFVLHVIKT
jgi:hypothetical protein